MKESQDPDLLTTYDLCKYFGLSIEAIRKYKTLGLIEPCKRVGRRDLYDKEDITLRKHFIESQKKQGKSLQEITKALNKSEQEQDFAQKRVNDQKIKKVLILEDYFSVFEVLQRYLWEFFDQDELEIYHAKDGLTGIEQANKIQPDLIVLDVVLPILSGIEVYEKLNKHPRVCHSKFIIMSGNIEYKPNNEVFLPKPLKITEFVKAVENLIGLQATNKQLPV